MDFQDTMQPYDLVNTDPIQYTYCHEYDHISRYKGLRQVIHQADSTDRYITLETPNEYDAPADLTYYTVPANRENRLDVIAKEQLGSASYRWVLAYFNNIEDGFTCRQGTRLAIPRSISELMESGQILAPISVNKLNLGSD